MNITCTPFGKTKLGTPVLRYTLSEGALTASVLTLGGILQSLTVPDRNGVPTDVVLGFDSAEAYEQQDCYIGALIGRCANRIAGGRFLLNDRVYQLACNENGVNHLHGGMAGFDRRDWIAAIDSDGLTLHYHSPAGEEGYPGSLHVTVTYCLSQDSLSVDYHAVTDAPTLCSLTNHSYFNLAGHASGPVGDQLVSVAAEAYTPIDENSIPTGELAPVENTPLDLRAPTPLGAHWDDAYPQLALAHGYDHNYAVSGAPGVLRPAASAQSGQTGITLAVSTTLPGIQLYSGNFLKDSLPVGKSGVRYGRRHGFCLETQFYPGAPAYPQFPQPTLYPGQTYHHQTVFRFGAV